MKPNYILLLLLLLLNTAIGSAKTTDDVAINRLDKKGERIGYWVLDEDNNPVGQTSENKAREGMYKNGRKEGVWILYFEDGTTPRIIGEYSDNRPSGAYFRFKKHGELVQASSVPKRISPKQSVQVSNPVFSCRMLFDNKDIVAGQVFFANHIFKQQKSVQFWMESSMNVVPSMAKEVDYTWLNSNYNAILTTYLKIRTPRNLRADDIEPVSTISITPLNVQVNTESKSKNYYYPPQVKLPRVGKGLTFMPNGFNKLYTESNEIWMDGHFEDSQLKSGKVFIYDKDGILLKVRVYKDGVYESDGVL